MTNKRKGFTLIELILTITILAVLVAILVVALNPAEQLQRARDAKRVADLDALKTALNLYLAQATATVNMSGDSTPNNRCIGGGGTVSLFTNTNGAAATSTPFTATVNGIGQYIATTTSVASGTSWLPALIGQTPGGSPIAVLPLDPTNGTGSSVTRYYAYGCRSSNNTFEITTRLESTYFNTDINIDATDGGNSATVYEVGSDLTIVSD